MIYKLRDLLGVDELGGTMRLGSYACELAPGSLAQRIYGADRIHERHRHRYEFNCLYERTLTEQRPADLRPIARRQVRGDRRAAGPSVVSGRAVPSGVQVEADAAASAVCRLRRGELQAQDAQASQRRRRSDWPVGTLRSQPSDRRTADSRPSAPRIMSVIPVTLGDIAIGGGQPVVLMAGPCVIESEAHATESAPSALVDITDASACRSSSRRSYDKANRTSGRSFRGPGLAEGLRVLGGDQVSATTCRSSPTSTRPPQAAPAAEVADVLQIPAFLSRQTDLIVAAAETGRIVNIKKGQFLAPDDVKHAVAKVRRRRQSAGDRHRARHELRLSQPGRGHARASR